MNGPFPVWIGSYMVIVLFPAPPLYSVYYEKLIGQTDQSANCLGGIIHTALYTNSRLPLVAWIIQNLQEFSTLEYVDFTPVQRHWNNFSLQIGSVEDLSLNVPIQICKSINFNYFAHRMIELQRLTLVRAPLWLI
jgi:hypothetical protein